MNATAEKTPAKKITLATVKSFLKKNEGKIYFKANSDFNGMTDCVESVKDEFKLATKTDQHMEHSYGIDGAWFVGYSRDYFKPFETDQFTGIYVYNSCGSFYLGLKK